MRTFWDKQPVPQEGLKYKQGEDIEKEKKVVEEPVKLPNGFSWKVCSVKEAHPLLSEQYLDGKTNILRYSLETLKWAGESPGYENRGIVHDETQELIGMIMWLFIGSWTFSSVFSYLGGHEIFEHFFTSIEINTWQFLIITQIIIFLLGWPLEWTEILIIFVPIFLPLLEVFDVNPYFFAMLIALNLQTSFLTPPMAMSAYYLKGVQKKNVELMEIFAGIMPFLGIVIFAMFLMYMFPGIALWLPETLFAD